jgi:hypothetical protein
METFLEDSLSAARGYSSSFPFYSIHPVGIPSTITGSFTLLLAPWILEEAPRLIHTAHRRSRGFMAYEPESRINPSRRL